MRIQRFALCAITLGLLAAASAAWAASAPNIDKWADFKANSSTWPAGPAPIVGTDYLHQAGPTADADVLAGADLSAQESMAQSAAELTKLTRWQVWIGFAGTLAVAASLYFSAQATRAGFRAAKAAEKELASTLRPYVLTASVQVGDLARDLDEEDHGCTEIAVNSEVYGTHPAWFVSEIWGCDTIASGTSLGKIELEERPMLWPIKAGKGWGRVLTKGTGAKLSAEQRAAILAGKLSLYVFGEVKYRGSPTGETYVYRYVYQFRNSDKTMVPVQHDYWCAT